MKIHYPAERAISVWVGSFSTEDDFDKSVDRNVTAKLGLDTPIESICEIAFESEPTLIPKLIEGFSGWETFVEQSDAKAKALGCVEANAALVCYYLRCDDAPSVWGDLKFLGTFVGQDVA